MSLSQPKGLPHIDWRATGKRIDMLRVQNNFTKPALARALNLSEDSIESYIKGRRTPSLDTLLALCDLFHLDSVNDILIREEQL